MRRSILNRMRRLGPAEAVWMLGTTQVIGYGTVYYSLAILADSIAADFDMPVSWIFAGFSLALLFGGAVAPIVGRRIDMNGAPSVMAVGSLAAGLALVFAAWAPNHLVFGIGLIAIEIASTLMLYDAAFAALVQTCGTDARPRITHLTLIAGFASTLFWPLTTWLHGWLDWRDVFMVFAGLNLLVCLPLHLILTGLPRSFEIQQDARLSAGAPSRPAPAIQAPINRRIFGLVTLGFALSGFLLSAVLAQMVPMLTAMGLGASALAVSTLFGPAQVLVRFVNMIVGVRQHPLTVTIVSAAMVPLAAVVLILTAPSALGAAIFAILLGFGSGLKSIVQGTLPLALFGSGSYGTRLGRMALVRQFLAAAAPFAFAGLLDWLSPAVALAILAAVACVGLAAFLEVARIHRR